MPLSNRNVFVQIKPLGERTENIIQQQRTTLKSLKGGDTNASTASLNNKENTTKSVCDNLKVTAAFSDNINQTADAQTQSEAISTEAIGIVAADLCSNSDPGEEYYKRLAEQRREALHQTLLENRVLNERIESLEEELDTSRKELDEAVHLTEILKEFLAENDDDANEAYIKADEGA